MTAKAPLAKSCGTTCSHRATMFFRGPEALTEPGSRAWQSLAAVKIRVELRK